MVPVTRIILRLPRRRMVTRSMTRKRAFDALVAGRDLPQYSSWSQDRLQAWAAAVPTRRVKRTRKVTLLLGMTDGIVLRITGSID
jgi:hypothetical protein